MSATCLTFGTDCVARGIAKAREEVEKVLGLYVTPSGLLHICTIDGGRIAAVEEVLCLAAVAAGSVFTVIDYSHAWRRIYTECGLYEAECESALYTRRQEVNGDSFALAKGQPLR